MLDSIWYKKLEIKVEEESQKLYKNDFKFYQVDAFLNAAKKTDFFSDDCDICKKHKTSSDEIAENLHNYLKGDFKLRKVYEKKLLEITNHLKSAHKIYPEQYFISFYSLIGVLSGLALGAIISYLTIPGFIKQAMLFGFIGGLITGRIIGKIKDRKNKVENKTL
ncbi:MAG: hypothetical protein JXR51_05150 [Bacteroidales bacterium]|nr:hypothetical protein [Bacteroidales bacterium]MBN2756547.1 hypothetical protein [Bacteroidales bacterium]